MVIELLKDLSLLWKHLAHIVQDQGIHKDKTQSCSKWKMKKNYVGFLFL